MYVETRLKPIDKLQSIILKHPDNVVWQNSLYNII